MSDCDETVMRVLVVSATFPSSVDPTRGIFVKERIAALDRIPGVEVRVIAPTPWAPPIRSIPSWYERSQFPQHEFVDGLSVSRPRYPLPPKVGGYIHPQLMYPALLKEAKRIHQAFPFDLIDAHFVYPSGVAATRVARHFRVPVCMTGRGADMLRFPSYPLKGRPIRWALRNCDGSIALSSEIAEAMIINGAAKESVALIPNGVDTNKFRPADSAQCRAELGLPQAKTILLSVGDRIALKGFQVIVEALPKVLQRRPDVMYVCVGGPGRHGTDFTSQLRSAIARLGLSDRVLFPGICEHDQLYKWHNASDLYVLASSREGSPNALLEALACGLPAVSTRVGGAPDEIEKTGYGIIMRERSAIAAADAILAACDRQWNREQIRHGMENRSWDVTARHVLQHFCSLLPESKASRLQVAKLSACTASISGD
ncbi:glycosyltransferase family 4 protein [Roseiconus nitratireducens]|uniref:Glycosyltransferase family 4 protein n=1 Tax=Roseiconus nitratireducens TaxID=2605748 RepID=A0A5M6DIR7_9BACT|nr:glycosyltransferase [Roseiconus nitratireducens]KAA5546276.1 glycosyltransferase family 4 protein [Roseiconus nitratireducens]